MESNKKRRPKGVFFMGACGKPQAFAFPEKGSASRNAGKGHGTDTSADTGIQPELTDEAKDAAAQKPAFLDSHLVRRSLRAPGRRPKCHINQKRRFPNGRMADGKAETGLGDAGERRFFDG